jgi:hypothetical protein
MGPCLRRDDAVDEEMLGKNQVPKPPEKPEFNPRLTKLRLNKAVLVLSDDGAGSVGFAAIGVLKRAARLGEPGGIC